MQVQWSRIIDHSRNASSAERGAHLISLIKHSAIVSVIAVAELTTQGLNIISETFMAFEIWFKRKPDLSQMAAALRKL